MTALAPAADLPLPTDLPDADHPCVVVRYAIDERLTPCLRAVLDQPAETVVRRPRFVKKEIRA